MSGQVHFHCTIRRWFRAREVAEALRTRQSQNDELELVEQDFVRERDDLDAI